MKIDVKAQIKELEVDFDKLGKDIVEDIQQQIKVFSKAVYNEGLRLASERLGQSLIHYQNNLRYEKVGENIYQIFLMEGSPAQYFEEGITPFDMKPGFLASSKVKRTKDGMNTYMDIPFNIQPTSKSDANKGIVDMRSAVRAVLRDKTVKRRIDKFNKTAKGLSRFGDVTRYQGIKDPVVEGLVKVTPPGQRAGKYFIFRRVSKNSDPNSWMHPGYGGAKVFQDLEKYTEEGINQLLKTILK